LEIQLGRFKKLDSKTFLDVFDGITQAEISMEDLKTELAIVMRIGRKIRFLSSNSEARRELKENSISVNREKVTEEFSLSAQDLINDEFVLLQRGKKTYFILRAVYCKHEERAIGEANVH
jgi:tyrosyl-tRNA synthetase